MTEFNSTQSTIAAAVERAAPQTLPLAPAALANNADALRALITYVRTASLNANPRNARKHSRKQVNKVAASIKEFGFINPVVVDETSTVLVGHCRLDAATLLALESVPTIRLDHLSEEQKRAYMLADNRLAEDAVWDLEKLAVELKDLSELNFDFRIESTGFETVEIDRILETDEVERASAKEVLPAPDPKQPPVTRPGDLWRLGEHLILCGDATDPECFARLMGNEHAQMVIAADSDEGAQAFRFDGAQGSEMMSPMARCLAGV